MAKRTITVTTPDGAGTISVNVGPQRVVGAVRVTDFAGFVSQGRWMVSVHKTLANAVTGPNQTPAWNRCPRHAVAIDENDQPVGGWVPASK